MARPHRLRKGRLSDQDVAGQLIRDSEPGAFVCNVIALPSSGRDADRIYPQHMRYPREIPASNS